MKPTDTLQVVISDTHTGSNGALFLSKFWQSGKTGINHTPTSDQQRIRKQWDKFAAEIAKARKGKKVRLILDGDAVDGFHHGGTNLFSPDPLEHAEVHIEIMAQFQKTIGWQRGDELYYVKGTEVHTNDWEVYIGEQLNAVSVTDFLRLDTNGVINWFVHHGKGAGDGDAEGNALRNWLKAIRNNAMKDDSETPDIIYTGHVHQPTYSTYVYRKNGMNFKTIHGIILPSWQLKTRFAWKVAPLSKNRIGGVSQLITADGMICPPVFSVMEA